MTAEQQNVLIIKGIISELPAVQRETVNEMADTVRRMIKSAPEGEGTLAMALVGAELQANDGKLP